MNESSGNGRQPNDLIDQWCNNEFPIEMGAQHIQPLQAITGKRLENLQRERALRARLDPVYRVSLQRRGIVLTPEELQEPAAGNAGVSS